MAGGAPALYTIPPGAPFADALAEGLLAQAGGDALDLARATVILPTRQACRTLHEAFLRQGHGTAMLLPRLIALGDVDAEELLIGADAALAAGGLSAQIPEQMAEARRRLLLTRLIRQWGEASPDAETPTIERATRLAAELARLMDQAENEGLTLNRDVLARLAPEEHAGHWRLTLDFLTIVTEWWPEIAREEGGRGPAERRRRLLHAQAEAWRAEPPQGPVVAAGATGAMPAAAALLDTVARLPQGCVVLPGLDRTADAETWTAVHDDPTHPQHEMARLLAFMGVDREAVGAWRARGGEPTPPARAELVNLALKPASTTPGWRALTDAGEAERERLKLGVKTVSRVDCPGPREEAATIALMLREALTVPGKTAALVTPDRGLARRVASELQRWGIEVADSGGTPLSDTAPGTFLRLTARMLAEGLAPLPLLEALKHPLAAGAMDPGAFKARVRLLETAVLRGPRPEAGFDALMTAVEGSRHAARLKPWLEHLRALAADALDALSAESVGLDRALDAHMRFAEALASTDRQPGAARLWAGDAGEEAAAFAAEVTRAGDAAPPIAGEGYPGVLDGLMQGRVVRPRHSGHPRLAIWGPLEARLQRMDRMILGGLNEGTWPAESDPGPWLSRPMRTQLGLPPVEARIGLMAHDFAQVFSAPEVVLSRATRVEGTPTVPSRWLLRLDAVLDALAPDGDTAVTRLRAGERAWLDWAEQLDRPAERVPTPRPRPCPPVDARPRKLSVTQVETWLRDPYALYAEHVLGLRALDPLDEDPGAAERGSIIHCALAEFVAAYPDALPADPAGELERLGALAFEREQVRPGVRAFWWPRFRRIARWVAEQERARRADGVRLWPEHRGSLELDVPGGFRLTARADRVEHWPDGRIALLDYKTGTVPSAKQVHAGASPQLPLEAAIARAGGFGEVPAGAIAELVYWKLTGGDPPGAVQSVGGKEPDALADTALAGLRALVQAYDDPARPYIARPRPALAPRHTDYDHLARTQAWAGDA
ncbi:ATP-dependent helicase/nuclease subunit B [Limimonas halophila]|uniref:ATP-dependent helicase/nuclease subunit B n=1 Tax=Limimonas halophila TaxID=1082479 RepID=A0A1G7U108_9PROT|nr:double-strand break repair protein AddB [Limimonas halophila]SDG41097.1 ATP-dependent helicase/nuclease subunit B [Limimonas halophila]